MSTMTFRSVHPANTHTCALGDDGRAYCWGMSTRGELGNGVLNDTELAPRLVNVSRAWDAVANGGQHTCGLRADGTIACWGTNLNGQLGDASVQYSEVPTPVVSTETFRMIGAGASFTCGATTSRAMWCWGDNTSGQTGAGASLTFGPILRQIDVDPSDWIEIAGGTDTACAVAADHNLWCWGAEVGASLTTSVPELTQVPGDWKSVSAGTVSTCAIASDDSLACWGRNSRGIVGDGTRLSSTSPVTISAGPWRSVHVTASSACAIDAQSALWCWGGHTYSLGDGSRLRLEPTQMTDMRWSAVAPGPYHTIAIEESTGRLWCWGTTANSQCATMTTSPTVPEPVMSTESWTAIASGSYHSCGVTTSGTKCMGANYYGELGDGTVMAHSMAMPVSSTTGLVNGAPVTSYYTTCAVQGGRLWCWGYNYNGEVGIDTAGANVLRPASVPGSWKTVSTGTNHVCALASDGALWCWGSNTRGQLGNGNVNEVLPGTRLQVGDELAWGAVSAGGTHTCAIKTDSSLWCWGANEHGQLGIGTSGTGAPRVIE
jgi:alpha-tubulin suppressor-like RCC1 family protein